MFLLVAPLQNPQHRSERRCITSSTRSPTDLPISWEHHATGVTADLRADLRAATGLEERV
jgi:hypothetical protein